MKNIFKYSVLGLLSLSLHTFEVKLIALDSEAYSGFFLTLPFGHGDIDPVAGPQIEKIRPIPTKTIVIPDHADGPTRRAAHELSQWLGKMSGALFPVIPESAHTSEEAFHIGLTTFAIEEGISMSGLVHDGYLIEVIGENIFLLGNGTRGIMNAVFSILQEDFSLYWFSHNARQIPWNPILYAKIRSRAYSPPIEIREPSFWSARWADFAWRNFINGPTVIIPPDAGGHSVWATRTHNFFTLVPPEIYLKSNPEFFGLCDETIDNFRRRGSSLNLAHPEVLNIVVDALRGILKENPNADFIMIAQEDDAIPTMDPLSVEFYETVEDNPSALMIHFVNQVAERLENEFPHVIFVTYAYQSTVYPPKKVKPRDNVGVRLANMGFPVGGLLPVQYSTFADVLEAWLKLTPNVFIYDYWSNYLRLPAPRPDLQFISDNIRFFAESNVREVFGLGSGWRAKGFADRDVMKSWITAQLLWNPNQDLKTLKNIFHHGYYGSVAAYLLEYEDILEERRLVFQSEHLKGRSVWLLTDDFIASATDIVDKAIAKAESPAIRERVMRVRLSLAYQWLLIGPKRAGRDRFHSELEKYGSKLIDALETTRFATPWHPGESPPDWRNYWWRLLEEYDIEAKESN